MPNRTTSRLSRLRRARVPALGLALMLATSLTGCGLLGGSDDDSGDSGGGNATNGPLEKATITVAHVPVVDIAPLYVAINEGYFEEEGLTVETEEVASGTAAIQGILGGDYDIAFASYPAPIVAQSSGVGDFKIITEALAAKPGHISVVSAPNSELKTPQDAPGKRIAITAKNTFTDLAPMAVLESENVDFSTIEWVEMPFPEMIPAMQRGDVDGAVLVEPWRTIAEQQIGATVVFDAASGPTAEIPMSGYVAVAGEGNFVNTSPNTIAAFQRAMAKAQAAAADDRSLVEPILVEHAHVAAEVAPVMTISTYSTTLDAQRVQRVADLLEHFNVLTEPVDISTMVYQGADG